MDRSAWKFVFLVFAAAIPGGLRAGEVAAPAGQGRSEAVISSQDELPLGSTPRAGAARSEGKPLAKPDGQSRGWLLQTFTALAIVIALIFAVRFLLQRASGGAAAVGGGRLVELLARSSIGFKTHILFLRVNQRIIVASQTPQAVSALAVLDSPEDVAWVVEQTRGSRGRGRGRGGFGNVLRGFDTRQDVEHLSTPPASEADQVRQSVSELMKRVHSMRDEGKE